MSTNPVSMRLPIGIEGKAEPEVVETIQYHDDAITDLQQAIPKLKSQIDSLVTTVGAVTGSSSSSSGSSQSITNIINNIGFVNPQQGVTTYATQPSDEGALIILSDASPIAVTLTSSGSIPGITLPWYTFFLNLGSGTATLTPATGTISYPGNLGASSMPVVAEAMALVYFDGTNFWAATVAALSGSGTTGFVPVWTSSTALGDSHIDEISVAGADTVNQYLIGIQPAWFGGGTLTAAQLYALNFTSVGAVVTAVANGVADFVSIATSPTGISWIAALYGSYTDGTAGNSGVGLRTVNSNFNEVPLYLGDEGQIFIEPAASADYPTAIGRVFVNTILAHSTVFSAAGTPLPSAASAGISARAFVSDATANAYATLYVSGGSITAPVYCDGTNWYMG